MAYRLVLNGKEWELPDDTDVHRLRGEMGRLFRENDKTIVRVKAGWTDQTETLTVLARGVHSWLIYELEEAPRRVALNDQELAERGPIPPPR